MSKKIIEKVYYFLFFIFFIMLVGEFTLFKEKVVNEYRRCYTCLDESEKYLCDCKEIQEKERTIPIWFILVLMMIGLFVFAYSVQSLLESQKERLRKQKGDKDRKKQESLERNPKY